ncbi:MAG: DUF433 domain-containing protein [Candidatus Entotheonellia bacterium]
MMLSDRGRRPEVAGPRVTVYKIMDLLRAGSAAGRIATALHVTAEQARVARDDIAAHRRTVDAVDATLLQRELPCRV